MGGSAEGTVLSLAKHIACLVSTDQMAQAHPKADAVLLPPPPLSGPLAMIQICLLKYARPLCLYSTLS